VRPFERTLEFCRARLHHWKSGLKWQSKPIEVLKTIKHNYSVRSHTLQQAA